MTAETPRRSAKSGRALPLAPGPRYATPFSFLKRLRADSLGFLTSLWREYGDIVCIRMGPLRSYLVVRPEFVRHVMVESHRRYEKGNLFAKLAVVGGNGLLFSEGETWQQQRRWVGPAFVRSKVEGVVPVMGRVMNERLERWEREAASDSTDWMSEMSQLALDMVCRAMFGATPPGASFHQHIDEALTHANYLLNNYVTPPFWVPTRRNRAARRMLAGLHGSILEMVAEARARKSGDADLLGLLLNARNEVTGEPVTDPELLEQMITLLVAGHETTAMTLCWAFHLLHQNPEALERLTSEADRVLSDAPLTAATVARLEFSERVTKESLRLYPPVWAIPRQAQVEDEIGGYRVPRKCMVTMSPWITHRHPDLWENPESFDPDRFLPERSEGRPRHAFFPFGAGGRSCVGEHFAMLEATLALAMTVRRFEVSVLPEPIEPDPILTLRPRFGMRVRLRPR
jgi:cytochrome P450